MGGSVYNSVGQTIIDDVISHHGVKGMKWGVRRSSAELARAAGRGAAKTASKIKENRAAKKESKSSIGSSNKPKHLSDQELQALVNRLRLEQDLKRLLSETQPSRKGDGIIKRTLKDVGNRQLQRVSRTAADILIEQALSKHGAKTNNDLSREISKRLAPKKDKKKGE